MKHIKPYLYYTGINNDDDVFGRIVQLQLSNNEIDLIKNTISPDFDRLYNCQIQPLFISIKAKATFSESTVSGRTKISIYKIQDEWFIVRISARRLDQLYKCDQFDGLIKLLKDISNKKSINEEFYSSDKSEYSKIITKEEKADIINKKEEDKKFNTKNIIKELKRKLKNEKFLKISEIISRKYYTGIKNLAIHRIVITLIIKEQLFDMDIKLNAFEDEYYILEYETSRNYKQLSFDGMILIDGEDNIEPNIEIIIDRFKKVILHHQYYDSVNLLYKRDIFGR